MKLCLFMLAASSALVFSERQPGIISKLKCKEYSKIGQHLEQQNKCNADEETVRYRVARVNEFPHMVSIGFEDEHNSIEWVCGGSIISNNYILTTAQCLYQPFRGPPKYVRVGVININDASKQDIAISQLIRHPDYKRSSFYDDIGLIKLDKPIEFTARVKPACINIAPASSKRAAVSSWGPIEYLGERSDDLLRHNLNIIENSQCNKSYEISKKLRFGITSENLLCAADTDATSCQGDVGSPLQVYHVGDDVRCMYDVIGILSFGKVSSPTGYTRIAHYIKWIEDIVWPNL